METLPSSASTSGIDEVALELGNTETTATDCLHVEEFPTIEEVYAKGEAEEEERIPTEDEEDLIRTKRLLLRRAKISDLEPLYEILSNPLAMKYWSTLPHTKLAQSEKWLLDMINRCFDDYVIEYEGKVVGKAGVYVLADVGVLLHPDYWHQGIAYEALSAILPIVFACHSQVTEILADVDPRNHASIALFKKLGFVETGFKEKTFKLGEEWSDSLYFKLYRK